VDILNEVTQVVPTVSEKKTHTTDGRGPNHCSREIEEEEPRVGHLEKAGQRPGEYAEPGDEAASENGPVTVLEKKRSGVLKPPRQELEVLEVTFEKGRPSIAAQRVAETIAERRPGNRYSDRPNQSYLALVSQKTCKKQDGFAGHGQAAVFQHHAEEYHPVAVPAEEVR